MVGIKCQRGAPSRVCCDHGSREPDIVEKGCLMSRMENIVSQIGELSSAELAAFREWFAKFDASAWDRQLRRTSKPESSTAWPSKH